MLSNFSLVNLGLLIEKEQIRHLHFPYKGVLANRKAKRDRYHKLIRGFDLHDLKYFLIKSFLPMIKILKK